MMVRGLTPTGDEYLRSISKQKRERPKPNNNLFTERNPRPLLPCDEHKFLLKQPPPPPPRGVVLTESDSETALVEKARRRAGLD